MWPVHQRLGELWFKQKKRTLSNEEEIEFNQCLEANMRKAWKLAQLKNFSLMASIINDTDLQHEICQQIDKVYPYGREAL